jgi:hypothetical protein
VARLEALMRVKIEKKGRQVNNKKSAPSLHRLRIFFQQYDLDGDGGIDLGEFTKMLARIGLPNLHPVDAEGLFKRFDRDGSGSIDIQEFAAYWTDSFIDTSTKVRSITDLPCTRTEHSNRFKPCEQLVHEVKVQWREIMQKQSVNVHQAYTRLCTHANGNAAEVVLPLVEEVKHMLRTIHYTPYSLCMAQVKHMLRTRFNLAIGREDTLDLMMGLKV